MSQSFPVPESLQPDHVTPPVRGPNPPETGPSPEAADDDVGDQARPLCLDRMKKAAIASLTTPLLSVTFFSAVQGIVRERVGAVSVPRGKAISGRIKAQLAPLWRSPLRNLAG